MCLGREKKEIAGKIKKKIYVRTESFLLKINYGIRNQLLHSSAFLERDEVPRNFSL